MSYGHRAQQWFLEASAAGMDKMTAHLGREVIDSWENFWKFSIPDKTLTKMKAFGIKYPQAASHRWGIQAGPCPWLAQPPEEKFLQKDPRYSPFDCLMEQ